ncbi:histidine phosphatase family protein [Hyphomicrobium sp.]|uniref:histidine phosphatase family protein n=1 Tax=Hyphomicrobium sp. TaxID=82 RepID=UPI000FA8B05F|nr:histidine phosphatase family protein [Hyphomicrobium sp.]RUO97725.1 MAG: histidine phosphatase family protein [Hyphomicrobium sp.]
MNVGATATVWLKPGVALYLIRHGETDWNREARYQGQRDIPLNSNGRAQAQRHGGILNASMPEIADFDFVSSPLQRAIETMQLIRAALGLDADDFRRVPDIAELSYGHWEGELAAELPAKDPEGFAGKNADPYGWRPRDGESYRDLEQRVSAWLAGLEKSTVAVSHGGVSRVARGALLGIDRALVPFLEVPQDKILRLSHGKMQWL